MFELCRFWGIEARKIQISWSDCTKTQIFRKSRWFPMRLIAEASVPLDVRRFRHGRTTAKAARWLDVTGLAYASVLSECENRQGSWVWVCDGSTMAISHSLRSFHTRDKLAVVFNSHTLTQSEKFRRVLLWKNVISATEMIPPMYFFSEFASALTVPEIEQLAQCKESNSIRKVKIIHQKLERTSLVSRHHLPNREQSMRMMYA